MTKWPVAEIAPMWSSDGRAKETVGAVGGRGKVTRLICIKLRAGGKDQ
jgi:hypothetical protein